MTPDFLLPRIKPDNTRSAALENLLRLQERARRAGQGTMGVPSGIQEEPIGQQMARLGAEVLPPFSVPEIVGGMKKAAAGDYAGGAEQIGLEALMALATGGMGRKVKNLLKDELGIRGVLNMDATRMAELTPAQWQKLRSSVVGRYGLSIPLPDGISPRELSQAEARLLEESSRRSQYRAQQRMADALDPHTFREAPMPYADLVRSIGPQAARRRRW